MYLKKRNIKNHFLRLMRLSTRTGAVESSSKTFPTNRSLPPLSMERWFFLLLGLSTSFHVYNYSDPVFVGINCLHINDGFHSANLANIFEHKCYYWRTLTFGDTTVFPNIYGYLYIKTKDLPSTPSQKPRFYAFILMQITLYNIAK